MPRSIPDLENGTAGWLTTASDWTATGDFDITVKCYSRAAGVEIILGNAANDSNFIACVNGALWVNVGGNLIQSSLNNFEAHVLHIVNVTRVGTAVTLYIDGVEVGSGTSSNSIVISAIGRYSSGDTFLGYVFDVDLTDDGTPSNSIAWSLDEDTAATEDSTPSGNAVTYVNTPAADRIEFTDETTHFWGVNGDILEYGGVQQPAAKMIMLLGQSNMVGNAPIGVGTDDEYESLAGRIVQYDGANSLRKGAINALEHPGKLIGDMGLWRTMCVGLTGRKILALGGQGSTGFSNNQWNSGDPLYNTAVANANAAFLSNSNNSSLEAVVWLQGETDILDESITYLADLTAMRTAMIIAVTEMTADTPWIVIEVQGPADDPTSVADLNADLATFVAGLTNAVLIDTDDLTLSDNFHFDAPSLRTIGTRVAAAINTFLPAESPGNSFQFQMMDMM